MSQLNPDWNIESLNKVCSEVVDCINKTAPVVDYPTPYKMIRTTNVRNGRILLDSVKYVDEKTFKKWTRRFVPRRNDVILTREAPLGEVGILRTDDHVFLGQRTMAYRADPEYLDQFFLYYSLHGHTLQSQIKSLGSGATVEHLRVPDAESLKIPLPPLPTQKKIAAVLSAYDELIENNNRRIAILEKMAEELYREWFVRLRFPGHEKVKVEKGIPEGWKIKSLGDIGRIVTGKTPPTKQKKYYTGKYPFIKTPDMHHNIFILHTEDTLSEYGAKLLSKQIIPENSICISCIGTGGVVSVTRKPSITNQQINSVIPTIDSFFPWAFFTIKRQREKILVFGTTGTTMTNLSKGKLSMIPILFPDKRIIKKYHEKANPIFNKILVLSRKNVNLKQSRDLLLPRLISGKLDVEELDIRFPPGMREEVDG